jgi:prolyl 4-hydroxylase
LQILSWYPRIIVLPNFIDKARCQHIVQLAKDKIFPSDLAYRPGEVHDPNQQTRTSSGTFLSREEDKEGVLAWVEEKAARFTMLPVSHGEVRT